MDEKQKRERFEDCIMPHLDSAYNLARWLTGKDPDAQDIVQEAFLRAFRFFDGFHGGDSRSWILRIVRNTFYDWLHTNRPEAHLEFDENLHSDSASDAPDLALLRKLDREQLYQAIQKLPVVFREILVMRELEELSYAQIAKIADLPIGTVMSRLARARVQLRKNLVDDMQKEKKVA